MIRPYGSGEMSSESLNNLMKVKYYILIESLVFD